MSFYNKSTNFAVKDSLTTGDPNKIVSGVEIDTEFTNIASGFSSVNSTKVNVVGSAVAGNVATLTSSGNIEDSGTTVYDVNSLKTDLNAAGDMPLYAVRAWVNFDGTTNTIRGSGNVTSITRVSTGQHDVNFETAFEDINYSAVGSQSLTDSSNGRIISVGSYTTTSVRTVVTNESGTSFTINAPFISVQVVR